jgi:hypothetical protein
MGRASSGACHDGSRATQLAMSGRAIAVVERIWRGDYEASCSRGHKWYVSGPEVADKRSLRSGIVHYYMFECPECRRLQEEFERQQRERWDDPDYLRVPGSSE